MQASDQRVLRINHHWQNRARGRAAVACLVWIAALSVGTRTARSATAVDDQINFVVINSTNHVIDVLANDLDLGGEVVTAIPAQPANGQVQIIAGGTQVAYTPDTAYCNDAIPSPPDVFMYQLSGGSVATVSVVVACPFVLKDPGSFDTEGDPNVLSWYEARAFCRTQVGTDIAHSKCDQANPGGGMSATNGNSCPDIPACLPTDSPTRCGRRQILEMQRIAQESRLNIWTGIRWFIRLCSPNGAGCQLERRFTWVDGTPLEEGNSAFPFYGPLSEFYLNGDTTLQSCGFMRGRYAEGYLGCTCVGGGNDGLACDGSDDSCPGGDCLDTEGYPCNLCGCYAGPVNQGKPCDETGDCGNNGVCFDAGEYGVDCVGSNFGMLAHEECDNASPTFFPVTHVLCDNPKLGFEVCGCDDPNDCPAGFNSCGPGKTCSSTNVCWPAGQGQEGDPCEFPNDCAAGLSCDVSCTFDQECSHTDDAGWPIYYPEAHGTHTCMPTIPAMLGDSDDDGFHDQEEGCPLDPNKVTPGDCGCGAVEVDCDNNLISDCIDLDHPARFEGFASGVGAFQLNGTASVDSESIRLTEAVQAQNGSVIFEPVSSVPIDSFTVTYDFFMGGGTGADGMSFALIDADVTDDTILLGEGGANQPFVVSLDTYRWNPAGGNHALLRSYGATLADVLVAQPLDDATWQKASITFEAGAATLVLTDANGVDTTIFSSVSVPGWSAIRARYGFGARTGGATNEHRVDNVRFTATSLTNDCNGNSTPDPCDPDADGDGVIDDCDLCPGTVSGATVDVEGCPDPSIPADFDDDGDVDAHDVDAFIACASGPTVPIAGGCEDKDLDNDGDGDQSDFAIVQRCLSGENIPGDPNCAD